VRWGMTMPALVLAAVLATGCGTGPDSASASPPAAASGPSGAPPPIAGEGPPAAFLHGGSLDEKGAPGAEGSYTWNGQGSDAPWIVMPEAAARGAGPWGVTFDPGLPVVQWTARWAPVRDGVAGDPEAAANGTGSLIVVHAPSAPGTWSLQLEASFGPGRGASWYWTVDVRS